MFFCLTNWQMKYKIFYMYDINKYYIYTLYFIFDNAFSIKSKYIAISMKDIHHDNRFQQGIELNEVSKVIDTNNIQKNIRDRNRAISAILDVVKSSKILILNEGK